MAVMIDRLTTGDNYNQWHSGDKQNGATKNQLLQTKYLKSLKLRLTQHFNSITTYEYFLHIGKYLKHDDLKISNSDAI